MITDEQQIRFTELFGKIEKPGNNSSVQKVKDRRLSDKMADVSNVDKKSKVMNSDDPVRIFNLSPHANDNHLALIYPCAALPAVQAMTVPAFLPFNTPKSRD